MMTINPHVVITSVLDTSVFFFLLFVYGVTGGKQKWGQKPGNGKENRPSKGYIRFVWNDGGYPSTILFHDFLFRDVVVFPSGSSSFSLLLLRFQLQVLVFNSTSLAFRRTRRREC